MTEHIYHLYERNCWTPEPEKFVSSSLEELVSRIKDHKEITIVQYHNPSLIVKYSGDIDACHKLVGKLPFGINIEQFPDDWKPS